MPFPGPAHELELEAREASLDDLAAVTAPITLVRGERGFVTPADADEFRRRLPSATLVDAPSGHNVQEEAPVLLAALIGDIARD